MVGAWCGINHSATRSGSTAGTSSVGWFGARRHRLGWSQRYLEMLSGIDQTVISRIENGKQYGLRWLRFADLVDALGGLDGLSDQPSLVARAPFGARLPHDPPEPPPIDIIDLTGDLDGWEERHGRGAGRDGQGRDEEG